MNFNSLFESIDEGDKRFANLLKIEQVNEIIVKIKIIISGGGFVLPAQDPKSYRNPKNRRIEFFIHKSGENKVEIGNYDEDCTDDYYAMFMPVFTFCDLKIEFTELLELMSKEFGIYRLANSSYYEVFAFTIEDK
jgi:hypothetical protein